MNQSALRSPCAGTSTAQRFALWPASSAAADYLLTGCVPIVITYAAWLVFACTQYPARASILDPQSSVLSPFPLLL